MRAVLGVLSLLIVLAVVGVLAKKQLGALSATPGKVQMPAVSPDATSQAQSQQMQQQIRQTVESTLQQARPMPDGQ
ncbi:MAG: hypothetical protein ACREVW_03895 [Burkholderiales bacterium]